MQTERGFQILSALANGSDPGATADDLAYLGSIDLLQEAAQDQRALFATAASGLDRARGEVRDLRRSLDLAWGPKGGPGAVGGASSVVAAQSRLRLALDALESASLARATLDSLVPNPTTGTFASLTLSGREALADLEIWRGPLGTSELGPFLAQIDQMQDLIEDRVRSAEAISDELEERASLSNVRWSEPAMRASALLLALRSSGVAAAFQAATVAQAFAHATHHGASGEDRLLVATVIAATNAPWELSGPSYEALRSALLAMPPFSTAAGAPVSLLAASLTDLALEGRMDLVARAAAMASAVGSADPLGIASLVRSSYSPNDAVGRYREATGGLERVGYAGDHALPGAAGVLAASPVPASEFLPRLTALDPSVRALFPSAPMADALLASLAVGPRQALQLHKYCVGTISRRSFFTETTEVDYLALFLTVGVTANWTAATPAAAAAPPGTFGGEAAGPLPSYPAAIPLAAGVVAGAVLLPALFAAQSYWLYRSYLDYNRQHPVHANAVPIYG